jgi:hypothetical protein
MLKLAFLLIGPQAFQARWYVLAILGTFLICLAFLLAIDFSPDITFLTEEAFGIVFVINGIISIFPVLTGAADRTARLVILLKSLGLIFVGCLILDVPVETEIGLALLFAAALLLDGGNRIAFAIIVRYSSWRSMICFGLLEVLFAISIGIEWPLPQSTNIPLCIALLLGLWGGLLFRLALLLRTLDSEVAILALPIFARRGWYDNAPVLVDTGEIVKVEHPLTIHVWTPVASAVDPARRLLIDRYIAAVDGNGVISTGHSALEMLPDVYISHYPAQEVDRSQADLLDSLRGTAENNIRGRFQPSYEYESGWWCPADGHVQFRNYNPRRLKAFWVGYRQDDTYNLTNRNCSVLVAAALDAALEGSLATRFAWFRLAGLMLNPDLWVAAMICSRATSMTWTPGLVLDYARTLARIVEVRDTSWATRFHGFLQRLRSNANCHEEQVHSA